MSSTIQPKTWLDVYSWVGRWVGRKPSTHTHDSVDEIPSTHTHGWVDEIPSTHVHGLVDEIPSTHTHGWVDVWRNRTSMASPLTRWCVWALRNMGLDLDWLYCENKTPFTLCFFLSTRAYPIFPNHISGSQCNSLCHVTLSHTYTVNDKATLPHRVTHTYSSKTG